MVGQFGILTWNARLDSQLGTFHWEAEKNVAASLMMNSGALMAMNSAFGLLDTLLPEREEYPSLYDATMVLLEKLQVDNIYEVYLNWEINLLRELGYALDLHRCSGCGKCENLSYLSPRTGRAVCADCALPYINRLYKLPINLSITLRFLDNVCLQQGAQLPIMRKMLKLN